MTTVAYKDGMIAADTRTTEGNVMVGSITKIAKTPDGRLVGGAGGAVFVHELLEWAKKGKGAPPETPEGSGGILIATDGTIHCLDHGGTVTMEAPFIALGSGSKFALASMAMGGSAEDAVRIASDFDVFTGGRIDVLTQ